MIILSSGLDRCRRGVSKVVHTPAWSFTFPWNGIFEQIHEILREGKNGTDQLF